MLYNTVMVSTMHQRQSAIGDMFPPSWTSFPPPSPSHPSGLSQEHWLWVPSFLQWITTGYVFCLWSIYVSVLFSQIIPPSPSPTVSRSLFSMCASPFLPCGWVCQHHLSRWVNLFHMHAMTASSTGKLWGWGYGHGADF